VHGKIKSTVHIAVHRAPWCTVHGAQCTAKKRAYKMPEFKKNVKKWPKVGVPRDVICVEK